MIPSILAVIFTLLVMAAAWLWSDRLCSAALNLPIILGGLASTLVFFSLLPAVEALKSNQLRQASRMRLKEQEGFLQTSGLRVFLGSLVQRLNAGLEKYFQKGLPLAVLGWWRDSGAGSGPLSLLMVLSGMIGSGYYLGHTILETPLLRGFILCLLLLGFFVLIYSRARLQRRLFQDQFPTVLERLADSLQAGFSLPQAIEFVVPNLSQPSSEEMARVTDQIKLGFSLDQALHELYKRRPSEDVRILVEGLTLQRQVGGDMSTMMRDLAHLVRNRVELENEVKTLTAQGRLSAVVIALLVPVSLGLLSLFPGYTAVLFNSTLGNLVLVVAGFLEVLGAVLVARLVRIEV